MNVALVGNPNSGKTTLFNLIAGTNYHVANYPGITVERKYASIKFKGSKITFNDLPGTYSLTAYSEEEKVTRRFILDEKPDLIVQVVDASNLERNLYLTIQILEMGVPIIIVLNMMDVAVKRNQIIDCEGLSAKIGIPIIATIARTGKGKEQLLHAISDYEHNNSAITIADFSYGDIIDSYLEKTSSSLDNRSIDCIKKKWTALKIIEGDQEIISQYPSSSDLLTEAEKTNNQIKKKFDSYPESIIADHRYGIVKNITKDILTKKNNNDRLYFSDLIDKILTQRIFGPIILLLILYLTYKFTFWASEYPIGLLENLFGSISDLANSTLPEGLLKSLIISGIIDGVGGILGFTPLIFFMFFVIAILEDSGYMARMAYMLDRVFRWFGLQGNSVVSFIVSGGIAGGCAVPGVMAARTIKGKKERLLTILTAPFMPCGAKIPVFALLISAFFTGDKGLAMLGITILSWVFALFVAKAYGKIIMQNTESSCFIMELPPYRFPTLKGLLLHSWERTWMYIKKAGTIILAISIILWLFMTFPQLNSFEQDTYNNKIKMAQTQEKQLKIENEKAQYALKKSFAGKVGTAFEPISQFAGFDWRTNIALLGGFAAKEVVISTLGTAYSLGEVDPDNTDSLAAKLKKDPHWSLATAIALILFTILYAPCFVTVAAIIRETASYKWGFFSIVSNTLIAYIFAVLAYQLFK